MFNTKKNGFTLVELLVTVAILGILLAVGIPSFQGLILNSRMTTQANEFLTILNYTRSEAIKRNTRVTVCKSSNGTTCAISASTEATASWRTGWIVFVDGGTAGILDGGDSILRVQGALSGGGDLMGNANVINYVSYVANGHSQLANGGMQGGTFSLCSSVATGSSRNIVLTDSTGRVRVDKITPAVRCS